MELIKKSCFIFLFAYHLGCVEPYPFQEFDSETVVVVDASFTNEEKVHSIILSTTYPVTDSERFPLTGATVAIEDDLGNEINFLEVGSGRYETSDVTAGIPGRTYFLKISTGDGLNIVSTPEELFEPSNIDSVYGEFISFQDLETGELKSGIQFYADASSDLYPTGNYRFEYNETYELRVPYPSEFEWIVENQEAQSRDTIPAVCYSQFTSNRLLQGTTRGLKSNRLSNFPLRFIDELDPELAYRYSLEMALFSISDDAYDYHAKVREINESGGSFFDRQKGTVFGNLTTADSSDQVILGYFEVAGISRINRIFSPTEFIEDGFTIYSTHHCWQYANPQLYDLFDTVNVNGLTDFYSFFENRSKQIHQLLPAPFNQYVIAPVGCADCRHWGGELRKPEFWN